MERLENTNSMEVLPFAIALGEHEKLINYFIKQGQYKLDFPVYFFFCRIN